jgi:hypothetical protein
MTGIPRVCYYCYSTVQNSENFYPKWMSEKFLFHGTTGIPPEQTNCSVYSAFRGIFLLLSEIASPNPSCSVFISNVLPPSLLPCIYLLCPASISLALYLSLMPCLHPSCIVFFSYALPQSLLLCIYLLCPVCIPLAMSFSLMACLHPSCPV